MSVKDSKELFIVILSDLRQSAERVTKCYEELVRFAEDRDIKEALQARVFVSDKILDTLDECFNVLGAPPVKVSGRIHDAFVEDFRREIAEIQSPVARRLFILARASRLMHLRMGEYAALIAAADLTGHHGVGVLLESCLADESAFVERTRHLIRHRIQESVAA